MDMLVHCSRLCGRGSGAEGAAWFEAVSPTRHPHQGRE